MAVDSETGRRSAAAASAAFCFWCCRCLLRRWVAFSLTAPAEALGGGGAGGGPVEASGVSVGMAACFLTGFTAASAQQRGHQAHDQVCKQTLVQFPKLREACSLESLCNCLWLCVAKCQCHRCCTPTHTAAKGKQRYNNMYEKSCCSHVMASTAPGVGTTSAAVVLCTESSSTRGG